MFDALLTLHKLRLPLCNEDFSTCSLNPICLCWCQQSSRSRPTCWGKDIPSDFSDKMYERLYNWKVSAHLYNCTLAVGKSPSCFNHHRCRVPFFFHSVSECHAVQARPWTPVETLPTCQSGTSTLQRRASFKYVAGYEEISFAASSVWDFAPCPTLTCFVFVAAGTVGTCSISSVEGGCLRTISVPLSGRFRLGTLGFSHVFSQSCRHSEK